MKKLTLIFCMGVGTAYAYDSTGNRMANITCSDYAYDSANRMLSDCDYNYTYDANGNQTSQTEKGTGKKTENIYNSENRIVKTIFPDGVYTTFTYDGLGRRIENIVHLTSGQTLTRRYVYDGMNVLAILDENNSPIAIFTHGPGPNEPLMMTEMDGTETSIHTDGLGSVVALADKNANVIERVEYAAFGEPFFVDVRGSSPIVSNFSFTNNPFAFTGQEWDPLSKSYSYHYRDYDPRTGRFKQEDPIGFYGEDTNLYTYVGNNPVSRTDPYGLAPIGPTDQLKWPHDDLRERLKLPFYRIGDSFLYKYTWHYFYDPYHDYFQKPSWSFDIAFKLLTYKNWVPGFPMFLPLKPYKDYKESLLACPAKRID